MSTRHPLMCSVGAAVLSGLAVMGTVRAQELPAPPVGVASGQGQQDIEVRLRGPVHEAFAMPVEKDPQPGLVVPKQPPEPVNELPPEVRPTGDNVTWIPGYWAWSDEDKDFLWVSGVWRKPPPNQKWVPGHWSQAEGGWRWTPGMWVAGSTQQLTYLQQPPASLERGPSGDAPDNNSFWVPGCWIWQTNNYAWRPGYWADGYDQYCWIPDNYTWTPRGYVFCNGYWDYYLDRRGWLFSPVWFGHNYWRYNSWYRPWYLLDSARLLTHWWIRPSYYHYYFGNWYGHNYGNWGLYPWYSWSHGRGYDPLFTYYAWYHHKQGIDFHDRMVGWNRYYDHNRDARPYDKLRDGGHLRGDAHSDKRVLGTRLDDFAARRSPEVSRLSDSQTRALTNTTRQMRGLEQLRSREEVRADAGTKLGRGGDLSAGAQSRTALRLPAVDQPLQTDRGAGGRGGMNLGGDTGVRSAFRDGNIRTDGIIRTDGNVRTDGGIRGGIESRGGQNLNDQPFRGGSELRSGTEFRGGQNLNVQPFHGNTEFRCGTGFRGGQNLNVQPFRGGGEMRSGMSMGGVRSGPSISSDGGGRSGFSGGGGDGGGGGGGGGGRGRGGRR